MSLTDYIPHAAVAALGAVVAWVGRDHLKRDDVRFTYLAQNMKDVSNKLDKAIEKQADNHAEILKLLLLPVRKRTTD